jgi:hypothetical protein
MKLGEHSVRSTLACLVVAPRGLWRPVKAWRLAGFPGYPRRRVAAVAHSRDLAVVRKLACPSHQVVVAVAAVVRKLACPSHQVVVAVAAVVRKLACPSHRVAVVLAAPTHYRLVVPVGSMLLVLPLAPVVASLAY